MRDIGILSQKWDVSNITLFSGISEPQRRDRKNEREAERKGENERKNNKLLGFIE